MPLSFPPYQILVATTMDELSACDAVRGSRFLESDGYLTEFDLKDRCATTHLLCLQGKIPVATLRIRFLFGTLIAWERLSVVKDANPRIIFYIIKAARQYCEAKGMSKVLGSVSNPKLKSFWQRQGATFTGELAKEIGGTMYEPMELALSPLPCPAENLLEQMDEDCFLQRTS